MTGYVIVPHVGITFSNAFQLRCVRTEGPLWLTVLRAVESVVHVGLVCVGSSQYILMHLHVQTTDTIYILMLNQTVFMHLSC